MLYKHIDWDVDGALILILIWIWIWISMLLYILILIPILLLSLHVGGLRGQLDDPACSSSVAKGSCVACQIICRLLRGARPGRPADPLVGSNWENTPSAYGLIGSRVEGRKSEAWRSLSCFFLMIRKPIFQESLPEKKSKGASAEAPVVTRAGCVAEGILSRKTVEKYRGVLERIRNIPSSQGGGDPQLSVRLWEAKTLEEVS